MSEPGWEVGVVDEVRYLVSRWTLKCLLVLSPAWTWHFYVSNLHLTILFSLVVYHQGPAGSATEMHLRRFHWWEELLVQERISFVRFRDLLWNFLFSFFGLCIVVVYGEGQAVAEGPGQHGQAWPPQAAAGPAGGLLLVTAPLWSGLGRDKSTTSKLIPHFPGAC